MNPGVLQSRSDFDLFLNFILGEIVNDIRD